MYIGNPSLASAAIASLCYTLALYQTSYSINPTHSGHYSILASSYYASSFIIFSSSFYFLLFFFFFSPYLSYHSSYSTDFSPLWMFLFPSSLFLFPFQGSVQQQGYKAHSRRRRFFTPPPGCAQRTAFLQQHTTTIALYMTPAYFLPYCTTISNILYSWLKFYYTI